MFFPKENRAQVWRAAIIVSILYYFGTKAGLAFSFMPDHVTPLRPGKAILLTTLFLFPASKWPFLLLAVLPAKIAAKMPYGISLSATLGWMFSDWLEVLLSAGLFRHFSRMGPDFGRVRQTTYYILFCVIIGPLIAAFPGAWALQRIQIEIHYWLHWRSWLLSDALTHLTMTPFLFLWSAFPFGQVKKISFRRLLEILALGLSMFFTSHAVLCANISDIITFPALLYATMPILLWASVRFGTYGHLSAALFFTLFGIWHALSGVGPFTQLSIDDNVSNLQIFLIITLLPFMLLASLIAERKATESALQSSEKKLTDLYDNAPDLYLSLDMPHQEILQCNRIISEKLGWTPKEIVGRSLYEYLHPDSIQTARDAFEVFQQTGIMKNVELSLKNKNEEVLSFIFSATAIHDEKGRVVQCRSIWRDITERKIIQAHLMESYKRDAIGTLAGGISHQFNNLLSVISGNTELLKLAMPQNEVVSRHIEPIMQVVQRMNGLTHQLAAYAQSGNYRKTRIQLDTFIQESVALIGPTLKNGIRIDVEFGQKIGYIEADKSQMMMVMTAILTNAAEAMEFNGRIKIEGKVIIKAEQTSASPNEKDFRAKMVEIRITDNGKGMEPETRRRLFDPFFSTKFQGRGLGMAAAYGIIQNHQGWIQVDSDTGKGTTVTLYLPIAASPESRPMRSLANGYANSRYILLVEDEKMVLTVHKDILRELGHTVLIARGGAEAIAIGCRKDTRIDLVLLDMMLPDMSGKAVFMALKQFRPELKVLICSGYSNTGPVQELLKMGVNGYIQKPFTMKELSTEISKVLGNIHP